MPEREKVYVAAVERYPDLIFVGEEKAEDLGAVLVSLSAKDLRKYREVAKAYGEMQVTLRLRYRWAGGV